MTRMVNDSIYSMGIMATKAETMTFLEALICSNTEYREGKYIYIKNADLCSLQSKRTVLKLSK